MAERSEPMDHTHRHLDLSHRPELIRVSDGIRPAALYDRLLQSPCHQDSCEEVMA